MIDETFLWFLWEKNQVFLKKQMKKKSREKTEVEKIIERDLLFFFCPFCVKDGFLLLFYTQIVLYSGYVVVLYCVCL